MSVFRTTTSRAIAAIAVGLALLVAVFAASALVSAILAQRPDAIDSTWIADTLIGSNTLILMGGCALICLVGVPLWLPLHFTDNRHWMFAALLGGFLFFLGWLAIAAAWLRLLGHGSELPQMAIPGSVVAGLSGALIASAMWRVAYSRL